MWQGCFIMEEMYNRSEMMHSLQVIGLLILW